MKLTRVDWRDGERDLLAAYYHEALLNGRRHRSARGYTIYEYQFK